MERNFWQNKWLYDQYNRTVDKERQPPVVAKKSIDEKRNAPPSSDIAGSDSSDL